MLDELRAELKALADPARAQTSARFFKPQPGLPADKFLGIPVPVQRKLARKYYKMLAVDGAVRLLQSRWHEERLTALFIMVLQYQKGTDLTKADVFDAYMANTKWVNDWDLVDSSAQFIAGPWLHDSPYKQVVLKRLASSENVWERRIAVLSTFDYIRRGEATDALLVIGWLLHDKQDYIHKANGWMLREIGKCVDRQLLLEFLDQHAATMPRTTLRYAIEHLSPADRKAYMTKR